MVGTVLGGFFLGTWSMGDYLPLRSTNLVYLFFLLDWLLFLCGLVALLRSYGAGIPQLGAPLVLCAFMAFCSSMASGGCLPIWGGACNIKNAWKDLLGGGAAAYDRECYARYDLIRNSTEADVVVPTLKTRPSSLYFSDLHEDPANWRNIGMADFFQRHSLIMR
jgi:hypothetical protein